MRKKLVASLLAATLAIGTLSGCGQSNNSTSSASGTSSTESGTVDTSEEVNLTMYLYGSEGVANQDVLDELNKILKEDINATLEIKYIDYSDTSTKYPLLWASGESFDMAYSSSTAAVTYQSLARQDVLVDITDMLDTYAPTLKEKLDSEAWDSMKVGGQIYGVPSTYSEFTAYGFVSRDDLMEKYGITSISSIDDMEAYMDAALEDGWTPLNGNSNLGMDMYRMFIALTSDWIDAPGLPTTGPYLAGSVEDPSEIFHPAFTDEFVDFAKRMKEWSDKGYWSKDVLSASQDDKDNFYNGLSASYISHQPDWTGAYGTQQEKLPGVETEFYCFPEENGKIIRKMGCENCTVISKNSKYPERCLMMIEKLMTDERCYDLFQYGIEGRQYEIVDGTVVQPEGYDAEKDAAGFAGWALRTDELNLPMATEDPRRYTLNDEWKEVAIDNPYVGFSFDSTNVSAELSAIANVDASLGLQILLGKTTQDPEEAVEQYRSQLEAAGIDKVLEEVNSQYQTFLEENAANTESADATSSSSSSAE